MTPRIVRALVAIVALAGLGACATLPTSGPVFTSDVVAEERGQSYLRAPGPRQDAGPVQIVTGFLNAQTGALTAKSPTGGFEIAQEFLTPEAVEGWRPTQKVVVYRGDPEFAVDAVDHDSPVATVRGAGTLVGSVDEHGVYTEADPGTRIDIAFDLVRGADGQWRVDTADGLHLSDTNFQRTFRATSLYFPTPDRAWFVPDERWFPSRNWQTYAVRETLVGPSRWLAASVITVAPEGTALAIESVPVEDSGPVQVRLNGAVGRASREDRILLAQQLEAVLSDTVPHTVRLYAETELLTADDDLSKGRPTLAPRSSDPVVVSDGQVMRLSEGKTQAVPGLGTVAGLDPTALAFTGFGPQGRFVVRDGTGRVVAVPEADAEPTPLFEGTEVLAPTIDRHGFCWTGTREQDGTLWVVDQKGVVSPVAAPWLAGRSVQSIRVAPDGVRIAVVSATSAGMSVDVAAIVRGDDALPTTLSEPFRVGQVLVAATQAVWVDQTHLGVLGRSTGDTDPLVHLVPVGGQTHRTTPVEDSVSVAAGGTLSSLLLGTDNGTLWSYGPSSLWTKSATGVSLPTYPG